ncbi:MAG: ABC transporter permease [Cytophagaceae bacterium]|nr:ABC transporter permease [Gemmatimonadaceae bacterium]
MRSPARRIAEGRRQLHSPLWRAGAGEEVSSELAFHIDMLTKEFVEQGLPPDEARAAALARFGDLEAIRADCVTQGTQRDHAMHRTERLNELRQDIRSGVRLLLRTPAFTAVAVLTLALGIGATTAIFSAVRSVVLRPFPFAHPERVMYISEVYEGERGNASIGNLVDIAAQARSWEAIGALSFTSFNLDDAEVPQRVLAARATAGLFTVLGVRPELGRVFRLDEDAPGADAVVVLSHALWQANFAGDRGVLERTIRLSGRPHRIIGVMPADFDPTESGEQLWVPAAFTPTQKAEHDEHYLDVLGLLKEGVTPAQAEAEVDLIVRRLAELYPNANMGRSGSVTPHAEIVIGNYRERMLVTLGAVGLVLLIACGNVANLLLARGATRAKELAIRAALGAGRGRIVRQLLTETLVLALVAVAVGTALAWVLIRVLVASAPDGIPRLDDTRLDGASLAAALALGVLSTVVAGVIPSWQAARRDMQGTLREGGRGMGGARDRVRSALVALEVALSLTLLVGAGLLVRSAVAMVREAPGFDPAGVLAARITLPQSAYSEAPRVVQALEGIATGLSGQPGVSLAAITSQMPMGPGGGSNGLLVEGRAPVPENLVDSRLRMITPRYLEVMRIPLLAGRQFNDGDVAGRDRVMIVSAALAKRLFPGGDALGKRILCCEGSEQDPRTKTIVGVAGDVRSSGLGSAIVPEFYIPVAQAPAEAWEWIGRSVTVVARGAQPDATTLVPAMRTAVRDVDAGVPLYRLTTMTDAVRESTAEARFNTLLLTLLGVIGLILAAVGISGVIGYFVTMRHHEISVRMALGATNRHVLTLFAWQGLRPILAGIVLGTLGSLAATRLLATSLYGVSPTDPRTFLAVAVGLLLVGLVATLIPARRAMQVEPAEVLNA